MIVMPTGEIARAGHLVAELWKGVTSSSTVPLSFATQLVLEGLSYSFYQVVMQGTQKHVGTIAEPYMFE